MAACSAAFTEDDDVFHVHSEDMLEQVADAAASGLHSGLFADLTVRCRGGEHIRAHKIVLAAVSPFIRKVMSKLSVEKLRTKPNLL